MGMNDFSAKVLSLQNQGFDFVDGKKGYKRETRMWRRREDSPRWDVCVVTLWDDDTVTDSCNIISDYSVHAGFVQR